MQVGDESWREPHWPRAVSESFPSTRSIDGLDEWTETVANPSNAGELVMIAYRLTDLPAALLEGSLITDEMRHCLFYATKGGASPLLTRATAELGERPVLVPPALHIAQLMARVIFEGRAAQRAVRGRHTFQSGFFDDADAADRWLRAAGATMLPIAPWLDRLLIIRIEGVSFPDQELFATPETQQDTFEARSKVPGIYLDAPGVYPDHGPGVYAFDRDDAVLSSFLLHMFPNEPIGPHRTVDASEVPVGTVGLIQLAT